MKPTRGELQARLEVLAKKKRSVKRKPLTSPESCPSAQGKILKIEASFSPSFAVGAGDSLGGGGWCLSPPWRFFLFWFGVPRRGASRPLLQCRIR